MSEEGFKTGDIVRLLSGGPSMTVIYESSPTVVKCGWFRDSEYLTGSFPVAAVGTCVADEDTESDDVATDLPRLTRKVA